MLSKITIKYHKSIIGGLLFVVFFTTMFGLLFFLAFTQENHTQTTGHLWWKETTEVHYELSDRIPYLIVAIALLFVTVICLIIVFKLSLMPGRFKKYLPIIKGCGQMPIQQIAGTMNRNPHRIISDLQDMIDSGYIKGYYIDYQRQLLVERGDLPRNVKKIVVQCPKCGQNTQVTIGVINYCQYCNSLMPDIKN
jgi:hypothetical protein